MTAHDHARPEGNPILRQTWGKLLFLHWNVPDDQILPLLPAGLQLDRFDGMAWVSITPFTMWDIRPQGLPSIPYVSESHELNVRTYVRHRNVSGVWFFSLDASNPLAVVAARFAYALPYYQAHMSLEEEGGTTHFRSQRMHPTAPSAHFDATWTSGQPLPEARPGSLEHFLVERYCLFARRGGGLRRAWIRHRPWPLRRARLIALSSTMLESHGLPTPTGEPVIQQQAEPFEVEIWPLERIE